MSRDSIDHLERAKDYIGKGEDYYRKAALEIAAAMNEDPTLGYRAVGEQLGRSDHWCRKLVTHFTSATDPSHSPFGGPEENEARYQRHDRRKVSEIAAERPEAIAEAITQADPEAQRKIADALIAAQTTEPSLKRVAEGPKQHTATPKSPERKLGEAVFLLWEAGEMLMDENPSNESKIRMSAMAEKAERLSRGLSQLLDTGEFEDAFRDLMAEMGAEV